MQFLLLLCYLWVGKAIQIQSTFLDTFLANGTQGPQTQWQQNTVTFSCSDSDPQDVNLVAGNISYFINCKPPLYEYKTTLRFFVPKTVTRVDVEYCQGLQQANITSFSPLNPTVLVGTGGADETPLQTQRRLLSLFTSIGNAFMTVYCSDAKAYANSDKGCGGGGTPVCACCCPPTDPTEAADYPTCFLNVFNRAAIHRVDDPFGVACAECSNAGTSCPDCASEAFVCRCINEGGDATTCNEIYQNDMEQAAEANADLNTMMQFRQWILNELALDTQTIGLESRINSSVALFIQAVQIAQNSTNITANMVAALAGNAQQQLDSLHSTFGDISTKDLPRQKAVLETLFGRELAFENATTNNFALLTQALQSVAGNVSQNLIRLMGRQLANENKAHQDDGMRAALIANVFVRRQLTDQIFRAAQQAVARGLIPFWHPSVQGSQPQHAFDGGKRTVVLDNVLINLINGTGSSMLAQQYQLTFTCTALTILNNFAVATTFLDIAGQLGPPGCASLPGGPAQNCRCWIAVTHANCPLNLAFNWQQLTDKTHGLSPYMLSQSNGMCAGQAPQQSDWDRQNIDDLNVLNAFQGQICSTPLASVPAQCSGNCIRQIQLVSERLGIANVIAPTNPTKVCALNYFYIFYQQPEPNFVFTLWTIWVQAQNLLLSDQIALESEFFGVPPGFITYGHYPFQTFSDNKTYECYTASFLAVSPETEPVFEIEQVAKTTEIDIQGFETPPVCDSEGCIFGTPAVSAEATVAGAPSVPFDFLLPKGAILGEWRTTGIPAMSSIFDTPKGSLPLDQFRFGSLTYTWQPIPDGYSLASQTSFDDTVQGPLGPYPPVDLLDTWLANNPQYSFSALGQGGSPDNTEVDFINGQCDLSNSNPGTVKQDVCILFDQFSLGPLTDMRKNGQLFLQPRKWSYVATAEIVTGEILQRVFAGCPQFKIVDYTNGYQHVFITNSLPTEVTVQLTVDGDQTLCVPVGTRQITLQPKQGWNELIPGCANATLNLYALGQPGGGEGFTTVCEANRSIDYTPDAEANVAYFTDDTSAAPVLGQAIQDSVVSFQHQSLLVLNQLVPLLLPSQQLTVLQRQDAIAALLQGYNDSLTATFNKFNTQPVIPTDNQAIQPFLQQLADLQTRSTTVFATMAVINRQISNGTGAITTLTALQAIQTNKTVEAINAEIQAFTNEANDIISQAKNKAAAQTGACNWCGTMFGAISYGNIAPAPVKAVTDTVGKVADYVPGVSQVSNEITTVTSPAAWICPILCALIQFLIPFVILALVVCCLIQCCPTIVSACIKCFQ